MECKNCRYFSGIKCHGHGEFWGECRLLNDLNYELKENRIEYLDVCYDDTRCIILEGIKNTNIINKQNKLGGVTTWFSKEIILDALQKLEDNPNNYFKNKERDRLIKNLKKEIEDEQNEIKKLD